MRHVLRFVHHSLWPLVLILGLGMLMVSCNPSSTDGAYSPLPPATSADTAQSPLATSTRQPSPQPTATSTCNPPWPTPPSEACPWLPSPTPKPTSLIPSPTPFEPPSPPAQTPTPLPLPQVADSPAGTILFTSFFAPGAAPEEPKLLYLSIDKQGQIVSPIDRWMPAEDTRVDCGRLSASPSGYYLVSIYDTEGGEVAVVINLIERKRTAFVSAGSFLGWHPNGREFLFAQETEANPGLWLVEASTGGHRLLAQLAALSHANFSGAAISPDGQVLAYGLSGSGVNQIWMANADGSEPCRVSSSAWVVFSWSPDGRHLLYSGEYQPDLEAGKKGTPPPPRRLGLMDWEGRSERSLNLPWEPGITFAGHQQPVWSPTGEYVANSGPLDASIPFWQKGKDPRTDSLYPFRNTGIYVEDMETGEMWLAAENALDPTWSPDGSMLAIARMDKNEQVDIWLVNVNNRSSHRITDTPELDRYPVWLMKEGTE